MKLTAASDTNRPSTCLHYQQPSERTPAQWAAYRQPVPWTFGKTRRNSRIFAQRKPKLAHGVHKSVFTSENARKKVYRPIWRQITTDILQSEKLHHTHSVSNHRRSNTSSGATEGSKEQHQWPGCLLHPRHRFTWSRTCLKAFRALPDQKNKGTYSLTSYMKK